MGQLCSRTLSDDAPEDEGGSCDASQPSKGGLAFGQLSAQDLAALAVIYPPYLHLAACYGNAVTQVGTQAAMSCSWLPTSCQHPSGRGRSRRCALTRPLAVLKSCSPSITTGASNTANAPLYSCRAPGRCTLSRQRSVCSKPRRTVPRYCNVFDALVVNALTRVLVFEMPAV